MNKEKIIEINGTLHTLDNIFITNPDIIIRTNDDEVHKHLMSKATLRLGNINRNVYIYLIDGKTIQVNGNKK